MPTIAVLVKNVPDTWSAKTLEPDNTLDRASADNVLDEINEYAVEAALRLREAGDYKVVAVTMGPEGCEEALRKAIAMGADDAVSLIDDALAGSDAIGTAWALHNVLNTLDDVVVVVAGNQSSDGETGAVPGLLAEYRQVPALTQVHGLRISGDTIAATREDEHGTWELEATLPALVTVTELADKPRFPNFKGMKAAKNHEITRLSLADIGVDPAQVGLAHSATSVVAATEIPARTSGEILEGPADDIAEQVVARLAEQNLI
ncbi:electron transfer flavoprotein subunit beta/FixA family protein [Corynebacterium tuscaniense]|uniref:electron transfer flavoprotein subunit beta/FixA family protein n=1 Tax=Corynebacterium tuscaniense TaxID=302449 RepID=UPI00050E039F|nr:electron transfer flavoprotein subunit beta/FixA family protein [Corynebacterium tuscaniense]KAA8744876.1 electron transfer flavoprotein subunit beta/FixA family protein [Corynebacterium tuscaniense]KGF23156.1 electron transfer flavoprotein subunit beta [Corynebacterium tuscaniense DNF00037]